MANVSINKFEEELIRRGDKAGALESMLSRFNHQMQAGNVLRDLKKHESYEKPCDKRNRKLREAIVRRRKKEKRDALYKPEAKSIGRSRDKSTSGENQQTRRKSG